MPEARFSILSLLNEERRSLYARYTPKMTLPDDHSDAPCCGQSWHDHGPK